MRDVTERLRALAALRNGAPLHESSGTEAVWLVEAADEIDRLRDMLALAGEDEMGRQQVESDLQFATEERDALQARIDGAKVSLVYKSATDTPRGHMNHLPAELIGKRVALVVLP